MVLDFHKVVVNHHLTHGLIQGESMCSVQFAVLDVECIVNGTEQVVRMKNHSLDTIGVNCL